MVDVPDTRVLTGLRRGVVEYCVLALIREGDAYAFDIVRILGERGLVASEGTIYPLLSRLRKDGFVTSFWLESESGPPRRYYRLTTEGEATLATFTMEWDGFRSAVDDVLRPARSSKRTARREPVGTNSRKQPKAKREARRAR